MAAATAKAAHRPLLKIKLGGDGDDARISAVRKAAPESELIVDANEAWTPDNLEHNLAACANAGVTLVEQPLPAGRDEALARIKRPIAVCADESVHDRASLEGLRDRYDAVNIKLDKTGGLTEALAMADAAHALGFEIMIGCMVATSLAMAPAMLLARQASFVDLDGPLLLAHDRDGGLRYDGSLVYPPEAALVGLMRQPVPRQPHHAAADERHRRHHVIDALPVAAHRPCPTRSTRALATMPPQAAR